MDIHIAGESGDTVVLVCESETQHAPFEIETSEGVDYLFTKLVEQEPEKG